MRRRSAFLLWVLIGAFAAGPALGAANGDKSRRRFIPPPAKTADTELRGPLKALAAAPPQAAPPPLVLPGPGASFLGLNTAGFASARPIPPLRVVGDPAPICRAECAKVRVVCAVSQDFGCDTQWVRCASDCSTGSLR